MRKQKNPQPKQLTGNGTAVQPLSSAAAVPAQFDAATISESSPVKVSSSPEPIVSVQKGEPPIVVYSDPSKQYVKWTGGPGGSGAVLGGGGGGGLPFPDLKECIPSLFYIFQTLNIRGS